PRRVRPAVLAADLAVSDRDQPVPEHAARRQPAPPHRPPATRDRPARTRRRRRCPALAGTLPRRPARPPRRPAPRTGGPLRDHRGHLPGLHHRPATTAPTPARRARP